MRTTRISDNLYTAALKVMPGGVSSPVRAFRGVEGTPIYFRSAYGSRFEDVDGNENVDFCMSFGPLIMGHGHPDVVRAVQETASSGLSFGACCKSELTLASMIADAVKCIDMVRFVNSGTEAVMTAIRLARAVTGREMILKFEGGYHGHTDSLLVKAGSGLATFGMSSSAGISESVAENTVVCHFDDETELENVFRKFGSKLAAAIVEPVPANNGLLTQRVEWLRSLRKLSSENGCLLIFDEVITGFRLTYGSYAESMDIPADLMTFGKIIGGGMPVGAIAGPSSTMLRLAPSGDVYQAGTLSGNPVTMAAGAATLNLLRDGSVYTRLEDLGKHLDTVISEVSKTNPLLKYRRTGSIFWIYLSGGPIPNRADKFDAKAPVRYKRIHNHLLQNGIYLAPSAYEVGFLSFAHKESELDSLADCLERAIRGMS